jgi:hypothetical protein
MSRHRCANILCVPRMMNIAYENECSKGWGSRKLSQLIGQTTQSGQTNGFLVNDQEQSSCKLRSFVGLL